MKIKLTEAGIQALGNINRYNGWTSRPYSVLEHTVIGAKAMVDGGYPKFMVRAFLLHDFHETEFGDDTRPIRRDYPNAAKQAAIDEFDRDLYEQHDLPASMVMCNEVANMDNLMLSVELNHPTLVTRTYDRKCSIIPHEKFTYIHELIDLELFRGDLAVDAWWSLWD